MKNRIYNNLDWNQPNKHAGFRKGYSIVDHIFTLNQILEKTREYRMPLCLMFIDLNKAFDSVKHGVVWNALINQGVGGDLIKVFKNMYEKTTATVKLDRVGKKFEIQKGMKQGICFPRTCSTQFWKKFLKI